MRHLILNWYIWLSTLSQGFVLTVQGWAEHMDLPVASALLFGLIGAASPCQLSTNLGALAYASRESSKGGTFGSALAYAAGKVSAYSPEDCCVSIVAQARWQGGIFILAGLHDTVVYWWL